MATALMARYVAPVETNAVGAFIYPLRIHATPGNSISITTGVTFHLFGKE